MNELRFLFPLLTHTTNLEFLPNFSIFSLLSTRGSIVTYIGFTPFESILLNNNNNRNGCFYIKWEILSSWKNSKLRFLHIFTFHDPLSPNNLEYTEYISYVYVSIFPLSEYSLEFRNFDYNVKKWAFYNKSLIFKEVYYIVPKTKKLSW